jgi:hypothetical protein
LHRGASWVIRNDPLYTAEAEGMQALALPAGHFTGWRLRYESPLYGPRDYARAWYGRDGYLRLDARFETEAFDENGQLIATVVGTQMELLDGIDLVGPGPARP